MEQLNQNAIRLYILDGKIDLALNLSIKSNDLISAKKVAKYSLEHNWINIAIRCYVLADDIDSALNTAIEFDDISNFLKLSEDRIGTRGQKKDISRLLSILRWL